MTVGRLCDFIINNSSIDSKIILDKKDKEALWETFKSKSNIEENPDSINDRVVNLLALINAKKQIQFKKINELIIMKEEQE